MKWCRSAGGQCQSAFRTLNGLQRTYTVEANGQLVDAAAYQPLIVAYRNGAPVRLSELGQVADGAENERTAAWIGKDLTRASCSRCKGSPEQIPSK